MGIEPARVKHLGMATSLGNIKESKIEQRGESITSLIQPFDLIPSFARLRQSIK
jgi:hypothetical protein